MKFFKRKSEPVAATAQLRRSNPPSFLAPHTSPVLPAEIKLYRAIRESVPLIDACIYKIIRLCGGLSVQCPDPRAQTQLQDFLEHVPTGRGQQGINAFIDQYLDAMLVAGQGVGEIVPTTNFDDIAAILCAPSEDVRFQEGTGPLDFLICGPDGNGGFAPLPFQNLLLFTPFNPEANHPYGVSLLRSMPALTQLLDTIYQAIGANWERMGNVRFAVIYKPKDNEWEHGLAQQRSQLLANEWSRAMASSRAGDVSDFVAVGDVDIKVIGADNQILDSSVPIRHILEQLVSKTGIPPFMLGLSWSSTERMSAQQADMLTTEMTAIRRAITPVIDRICRLWLRMHGFSCRPSILWDDINLQDIAEEAKADWYREQTRKLALENDAAQTAAGKGR